MCLIHIARAPETSCIHPRMNLDMPVVAAATTGMSKFNDAVTEETYAEAVVEGCMNAGIIGCTGDGVPPIITQATFAAITAAKGHGIFSSSIGKVTSLIKSSTVLLPAVAR